MKLEHKIEAAIFLSPKCYYLITDKGEHIKKIKGVSSTESEKVSWDDFEGLLRKDSLLEFIQEKWFKSVFEGAITIKEVAYNLKVTSNKRECIYEDDLFVGTRPFHYKDLEEKGKPSSWAPPLITAPVPVAVEQTKEFVLVNSSDIICLPSTLIRDVVCYTPACSSLILKGENLKLMFQITYTMDRFRPKVYWLGTSLIFNPFY